MNLIYINCLPDEIIQMIFIKMNDINKVFLNKEYYYKYHNLIYKNINSFNNYLRDIIRLDYKLIFENVLDDKFNFFIKNTNFKYNNIVFPRYVNYINFIINQYNSNKCKSLLLSKLKNNNIQNILQKNSKITRHRWEGK